MKLISVLTVLIAMVLAALLPGQPAYASHCASASMPAMDMAAMTGDHDHHRNMPIAANDDVTSRTADVKKDLCSLFCQMAKVALPQAPDEKGFLRLSQRLDPPLLKLLTGWIVPPLLDPPRSVSA